MVRAEATVAILTCLRQLQGSEPPRQAQRRSSAATESITTSVHAAVTDGTTPSTTT